jgi:CII-binding regulator of phage lambda lysogenization HflD
MTRPNKLSPQEVEAVVTDLQRQLQSTLDGSMQRIDCNPESLEQGLARLVLSLIELLRRLLERQAIRRMEGGSLSDDQIENMGLSLMKLEQKIHELCTSFGLKPADLNLELGPLGNLLDSNFPERDGK